VSEDLALEQRLSERRAIERKERTAPPGKQVNPLREHFFADACLSEEQDGQAARSHLLEEHVDLSHLAVDDDRAALDLAPRGRDPRETNIFTDPHSTRSPGSTCAGVPGSILSPATQVPLALSRSSIVTTPSRILIIAWRLEIDGSSISTSANEERPSTRRRRRERMDRCSTIRHDDQAPDLIRLRESSRSGSGVFEIQLSDH